MTSGLLALLELLGLGHRFAQHEDHRNDQATDQEGYAPAPCEHVLGRKDGREPYAKQRDENHGDLLAARLPAHVETLVARRRDFREINRHATKLDAGRETLDH